MNISLSLRQLFSLLFIASAALLAASVLQAWTGPTATAPGGNVAAPINVGTTDQVKGAGISVNSLAVFGSQYIQDKLGIGRTSPVVALDVNGSIRVANGGELCQAVSAGAIRYNSTSKVMEYCNATAWTALVDTDTVYVPQTRIVTGPWGAGIASCASNEVVVGGGGYCQTGESSSLVSSIPYGNGWQVSCVGSSVYPIAYAVCLKK